jgi:hypothetical protein
MPFVDFAELKTRVSIEQAMQMLGLNLVLHGSQYRGGWEPSLVQTRRPEGIAVEVAPFLKKLFADGGYQGPQFEKALAKASQR